MTDQIERTAHNVGGFMTPAARPLQDSTAVMNWEITIAHPPAFRLHDCPKPGFGSEFRQSGRRFKILPDLLVKIFGAVLSASTGAACT